MIALGEYQTELIVACDSFDYWVKLPWWMQYLLGKEMGWRDVVHMCVARAVYLHLICLSCLSDLGSRAVHCPTG